MKSSTMTAARHIDEDRTTEIIEGRITLRNGDHYGVSVSGAELRAKRAASCLLVAEPGDRVLVSRGTECFVLAVLERNGEQPAEMAIDGDATLHARGGRLRLGGSEGVELVTDKAIALLSRAFRLTSSTAEVVVEQLDVVGKRAQASFDEAGLAARTIDTMAERVMERVDRFYRFVGEIDRLRAGHIDYRAEHSVQIKGENTVMTARGVAKIDGEQIHMG
jgi:hypothetical protein